jgi:hypothetical protein
VRAFRAFALVATCWTAGRALILVTAEPVPLIDVREVASLRSPISALPRKLDALQERRPLLRLGAGGGSMTLWRRPNRPSAIHSTTVIFRSVSMNAAISPQKVVQTTAENDERSDRQPERVSSLAAPPFAPRAKVTSKGSISGYVFVRGDRGAATLSGSGLLGGSQAALFLEAPNFFSVHGIDIRPVGRLTFAGLRQTPDELAGGISARSSIGDFRIDGVVERRVGLKRSGRDAIAVRASIGVYKAIDRTPLTVSGYVHTGIVGLHRRDKFAEAEGRLVFTEGRKFRYMKPGVALWTAAQPQVSRIDIGPTLDVPVMRTPINMSIRTDWRFRIGGNARPASGPTLTLVAGY